MSGSKDRYAEFCRETYVPLQLQPWWLDAVCGGSGHWDVALALDRGGNTTGAMPFFLTRRWGLRVIQLPPLTAYAGPVLRYPQHVFFKKNSQYSFESHAFEQIIAQLPRVAFFHQCFRPEIQNWLPFYWAGYRQTTRYTYLLPDTGDLSALYAGLKNTVRTDLRKAGQATVITREDAPDLIFQLNARSFERKGLRQPYPKPAFIRLHEALAARGQSLCLLARDRISGAPHAGLYLVYDDRQAAVLLAGFDHAFARDCALQGLYWEAIRTCSENGLSLDFEGSMQPGIERVFRAFGGRLTPYFRIWKWGSPGLSFKVKM